MTRPTSAGAPPAHRSHRATILDWLKTHPGERHTAGQLAMAVNLTKRQVQNVLWQLPHRDPEAALHLENSDGVAVWHADPRARRPRKSPTKKAPTPTTATQTHAPTPPAIKRQGVQERVVAHLRNQSGVRVPLVNVAAELGLTVPEVHRAVHNANLTDTHLEVGSVGGRGASGNGAYATYHDGEHLYTGVTVNNDVPSVEELQRLDEPTVFRTAGTLEDGRILLVPSIRTEARVVLVAEVYTPEVTA